MVTPDGNVQTIVERDAEAAAEEVARRLADAARAGVHIVLTGGNTVGDAYEKAAELEPDWSRVELWWGDERCVPADDEHPGTRAREHAGDALALARGGQHQGSRLFQGQRGAAVDRRVRTRKGGHGGMDERVGVDQQVCRGDPLTSANGQQIGRARAGADEGDES